MTKYRDLSKPSLYAHRDRNYDDIDEEDPFNPQTQRMALYSTSRANVHSFCSYSSSLGSQSSLQPPLPATSTAPPPEYMWVYSLMQINPINSKTVMYIFCTFLMCLEHNTLSNCTHALLIPVSVHQFRNQSMLFAGNPRYENVPLIGRGSPPPSVC